MMENEEEKKTYEHPVRSRRIRFHPTPEQKTTLDQWFGTVRFCYNHLVAEYKNVGQGGVNRTILRQSIQKIKIEHPWLKSFHSEVIDVAVVDLDKARTAHFAKLKKMKQIDPNATLQAQFKFRSKKDKQQSFSVRKRDMIHNSGHFADLNINKIKATEPLPSSLDHDIRFVRDRLSRYFIVIPGQVKRSENQTPLKNIVSLDPGVRTFQTTYDDSGLVTEWGKGDMKNIFRLCLFADIVQSAWQKKKGSNKRSTKRAWFRVLDKIKNRVKEVHHKMAKWLCENYKVILIPEFETSKMVKKGERKIRSKTVRNMLTWSHYKFREMLKNKAELYVDGAKVIVCDEAYTSKTCGICGTIHTKLGGSKTFRCPNCHQVSDRDMNAARNILLRYLSLHC